MGNVPYPPAVVAWLYPRRDLDFLHSEADASEERLVYGLYNRSHTIDSLRAELAASFDVVECFYQEDDPRYVIAVVRPRQEAVEATDRTADVGVDGADPDLHSGVGTPNKADTVRPYGGQVEAQLLQAETICESMEALCQAVYACFEGSRNDTNARIEALSVSPQLGQFLEWLEDFLDQP